MKNRTKKNCAALKRMAFALPALLVFTLAGAQDEVVPAARRSYWMEIGPGWGGQGSALNIALAWEAMPGRVLRLRHASTSTNEHCSGLLLIIPVFSPLGRTTYSYDVAFGWLNRGKATLSTLSAGVSYVDAHVAGGHEAPAQSPLILFLSDCPADYHVEKRQTVGLNLSAEFIPCLRWGGIGAIAYVNINSQHTFGSFTLNMVLGRLRSKTPK